MRTYTALAAMLFLLSTRGTAQQTTPSASIKHVSPASTPDPGAFASGLYRNAGFGFIYKVPFGWVDRTEDMRQESAESSKSTVLLGVFERPPEAAGSTLNSAVVIAAESAASYPGLKAAAQYLQPVTEIATAKGLKAVNEPYEFPVDAMPIARRDFAGQLRGIAVQQSTLVLLEKGYVVSFTFLAGNSDEITELIEGLTFGKVRNSTGK